MYGKLEAYINDVGLYACCCAQLPAFFLDVVRKTEPKSEPNAHAPNWFGFHTQHHANLLRIKTGDILAVLAAF